MVQLPVVDVQVRGGQQPLARIRELLTTIFLHGLAGTGAEWDALQELVPAEAPDLRPYGTRDEYVADVVDLIGGRRVTLIGQSLGGHTAMLVAARHPELVARLVVIEASPERDPGAPDRVRAFFAAMPEAYGGGMDPEAAAQTLQEVAEREWWDEWRAIRAPVMVIRAANGHLDADIAERMVADHRESALVTLDGAGHDVHLDRPDAVAAAIRQFAS